MKNRKMVFYIVVFLGVVLIGAYLTASILGYELLCNILSSLISAASAATLIYAYVASKTKKTTGRALPFFALACISWLVADVLWTIVALQGGDPAANAVITYFYSFTNIFLFAAALIFLFYQFRKWSSVQLILDALVLSILSIMLIWIAFFHKDMAWIDILMQDGFSSAISIIFDFMVLIGLLLTLFTLRSRKIPVFLGLLGAGILLYSLADLYYFYIYANDQYIPNSAIDVLYVGALIVIALGGLWKTLLDRSNTLKIKPVIGTGRVWIFLFVFPLAMLFSEGLVWVDLAHFVLAIIMYKALSDQAQLAKEKDKLYHKEKELNVTLAKRVEQQYGELVYLANNDTVTKLKNRRFFIMSLEKALKELPKNESLAVFIIDLDRFKTINDTMGHDVGDDVLIEISARIKSSCSGRALLARLGGDEFALFARGNLSREDIAIIAEDIIRESSKPLSINSTILQVTLSVGIALYPSDADNRVALMRSADIAMYRAKSLGYNKYVFYDPFLIEGIGKKNELGQLLKRANIEKDFELYYQPQFDIATGRLVGAEAMLCWKSAELGYISTKEFIPVVEEIDYLFKIGKWAMNKAVRQVIKWNTAYSIDLKMGINISPKQFSEDDLLGAIKNLITHENFKSAWIDAEITEEILLESNHKINKIFEALKEMKVSVSIDALGAGYSTLDYLNKFPFDRIKIDKLLVDQLSESNLSGIQVVKTIVTMAEEMGIITIAEGVEKEEQLTILKRLKCSQAHGNFLGRPVSAADFEKIFIHELIGIYE